MAHSVRLFGFILGFALFAHSAAIKAGDNPLGIDPEDPFQPSSTLMQDVGNTLLKAKEANKLALIIMGADWCHDSRGLIDNFMDDRLSVTLTENYETLLVDVGFLEYGEDVIRRFGQPVIYGTPTVLVVDPETEEVINRDSIHIWRDAARISLEDTHDYFSDMATATPEPTSEIPASLVALYEQIDAFEEQQAERLYQAYGILAPLFEARHKNPENFENAWMAVRTLRYTITDDLEDLRKEARNRVAAGETDIILNFPDYPLFEWE